MTGMTFDSGALIALERADRRAIAVVRRAIEVRATIAVPAGVVAQVWRNGARQARLARFLKSDVAEIEPLDDLRARAAGQLCGATNTDDIVDASVVLCARRRGHSVMTSDPEDLHRLDERLKLEVV